MGQPNEILLHGLRFYRLDDGSLFPVLTGGMGGGGGAPAPTAEETRLKGVQADAATEQLKLARQQQAQTDALMPLLLQEYGLTRFDDISKADPRVAGLQAERARLVTSDAGAGHFAPSIQGRPGRWLPGSNANQGRIAAIDKELAGLDPGGKTTYRYEKTPDEMMTKRKEIEGMQLDRSLKALKGELPVTATLAKELELGKRTLAERLSRQLGPGWETSSAGIQSNAEYDRMATSLKEAEQKDQLTTAEALSINRQQSRAGNSENLMNTVSTPNVSAASLLSGAGGSAGNALNYYGNLRNSALRSREMEGQETAGYVGAGVGAAGLAVGTYGALVASGIIV